MQSRRVIAPVFRVNPLHITWGDMARAQLLRREVSPAIDIDAVAVRDAEGTLGIAHQSTHTLLHGICQVNVGHMGRVRPRHSMNHIGALGSMKSLQKSTVAA